MMPDPDSIRGGSLLAADPSLRTEVVVTDEEAVRSLVVATGMFSRAEQDVAAELVRERLHRGQSSGYEFVFAERGRELLGYACYGLIPCTLASFDLYWVAVSPREQGRGLGRRLLTAVESAVQAHGGRAIYVETSGRPQYAPTRAYYERCGYREAACFPDFYAPGDPKIVYVKRC